jgi:hypothetical protein
VHLVTDDFVKNVRTEFYQLYTDVITGFLSRRSFSVLGTDMVLPAPRWNFLTTADDEQLEKTVSVSSPIRKDHHHAWTSRNSAHAVLIDDLPA